MATKSEAGPTTDEAKEVRKDVLLDDLVEEVARIWSREHFLTLTRQG